MDRDSSAIVLAGRDVCDLPTVGDDLAFDGADVEGDDLGCTVRVVHERLVSAVDRGHEAVLPKEPCGLGGADGGAMTTFSQRPGRALVAVGRDDPDLKIAFRNVP